MSAERGKYIISASKSLKANQLADQIIARYLHATSFAGRAGLFASALKQADTISFSRAQILAETEGFSKIDLRDRLLPWLERVNLIYVKRSEDQTIIDIDSLILTYESLLEAVSSLYDSLEPTAEDQGCVQALEIVSALPMPESEVLHLVAGEIGEEFARRVIELAKNYRIVAHQTGYGMPEPMLFAERVWTNFNPQSAKALSPLSPTDRDVLLEFVNMVKRHQGIPESLMRKNAKKHNGEHMLNLGINIGLFNRTKIQMAGGEQRAFLTTPHFYSDMGVEFGDDMCDRVKIFLDSIRNGQHFGRTGTGRIISPDVLLEKLLNTGEIGPCTAIGTDYVTSERAGIVKVRRSQTKPKQSVLKLVQHDTVSKVFDIITTGSIADSIEMVASDVREGVRFASIEQLRGEIAELPKQVAEAEREIIQQLRES